MSFRTDGKATPPPQGKGQQRIVDASPYKRSENKRYDYIPVSVPQLDRDADKYAALVLKGYDPSVADGSGLGVVFDTAELQMQFMLAIGMIDQALFTKGEAALFNLRKFVNGLPDHAELYDQITAENLYGHGVGAELRSPGKSPDKSSVVLPATLDLTDPIDTMVVASTGGVLSNVSRLAKESEWNAWSQGRKSWTKSLLSFIACPPWHVKPATALLVALVGSCLPPSYLEAVADGLSYYGTGLASAFQEFANIRAGVDNAAIGPGAIAAVGGLIGSFFGRPPVQDHNEATVLIAIHRLSAVANKDWGKLASLTGSLASEMLTMNPVNRVAAIGATFLFIAWRHHANVWLPKFNRKYIRQAEAECVTYFGKRGVLPANTLSEGCVGCARIPRSAK
jgi:hypothetical protein